jgi:hypothetical protein
LTANRLEGGNLSSAAVWRHPGRVKAGGRQVRFVRVRLRARCSTGFVTDPSVTDPHGARHWLTFSFSVRARACRFRPASRPSGFCSRAFLAWRCHCGARLAARCTSGSRMTRGSALPGRPAMRMCSTHRVPHCTPQRAAVVPKHRNEIKATPVELAASLPCLRFLCHPRGAQAPADRRRMEASRAGAPRRARHPAMAGPERRGCAPPDRS